MDDPRKNMGFLISDVAKLLRREFNRRARALGLSQAQWQTVAYLSREEGVNQATLAERLDIQPITLARLVDRLEEAGLVRREADPNDRRAFRLFLTQKAQPLIQQMEDIAVHIYAEARKSLTDEQWAHMMSGLESIRECLLDAEPTDVDPQGALQMQKSANVAEKI